MDDNGINNANEDVPPVFNEEAQNEADGAAAARPLAADVIPVLLPVRSAIISNLLSLILVGLFMSLGYFVLNYSLAWYIQDDISDLDHVPVRFYVTPQHVYVNEEVSINITSMHIDLNDELELRWDMHPKCGTPARDKMTFVMIPKKEDEKDKVEGNTTDSTTTKNNKTTEFRMSDGTKRKHGMHFPAGFKQPGTHVMCYYSHSTKRWKLFDSELSLLHIYPQPYFPERVSIHHHDDDDDDNENTQLVVWSNGGTTLDTLRDEVILIHPRARVRLTFTGGVRANDLHRGELFPRRRFESYGGVVEIPNKFIKIVKQQQQASLFNVCYSSYYHMESRCLEQHVDLAQKTQDEDDEHDINQNDDVITTSSSTSNEQSNDHLRFARYVFFGLLGFAVMLNMPIKTPNNNNANISVYMIAAPIMVMAVYVQFSSLVFSHPSACFCAVVVLCTCCCLLTKKQEELAAASVSNALIFVLQLGLMTSLLVAALRSLLLWWCSISYNQNRNRTVMVEGPTTKWGTSSNINMTIATCTCWAVASLISMIAVAQHLSQTNKAQPLRQSALFTTGVLIVLQYFSLSSSNSE